MKKTAASPENASMSDFIFGTLATDELRLKALTTAQRGLLHDYSTTPRDPLPDQPVRIEVSAGPDAPVDEVFVQFMGTGGAEALRLELTAVTWDTLLWSYVRHFAGELPGQPEGTTVRYRILGQTQNGQQIWARDSRDRDWFSYAVDQHQVPGWARDAVIYQIFTDRFAPTLGQPFPHTDDLSAIQGGTLRGVLHRLDYLSELGVDALWLTPIFSSPSHHRYDSTDFREVDPRAGTRADLRALVDEMHRRGMRLILDFVPNHVSNDHPFFKSAVSDPKSPYHDYFTFIHWPDHYQTFFGVKALPQINNEHPAARQYVIDSATYWLEEYGIDGFRLDYAYGPSHDFWTDFYTAVKRANPDSFHFGEIVETPTLLRTYEGVMDGALDFNWLQMSRKVFAYGSADVGEFEQFLNAHEAFFSGRNFILPTFLDNHDMNRFLWVSRGDKRRLMQAAVCQFTLAAPPVIYYGTEVALSQRDDTRQGGMEASRLPMLWGEEQDRELFRFYQRLIRLRRESMALRRGTRTPWLVDPATGRYAYKRQGAGETILVLFNVSGERRDFELGSGWKDAFDGRTLLPVVRLDPYGFLIARQQ